MAASPAASSLDASVIDLGPDLTMAVFTSMERWHPDRIGSWRSIAATAAGARHSTTSATSTCKYRATTDGPCREGPVAWCAPTNQVTARRRPTARLSRPRPQATAARPYHALWLRVLRPSAGAACERVSAGADQGHARRGCPLPRMVSRYGGGSVPRDAQGSLSILPRAGPVRPI